MAATTRTPKELRAAWMRGFKQGLNDTWVDSPDRREDLAALMGAQAGWKQRQALLEAASGEAHRIYPNEPMFPGETT